MRRHVREGISRHEMQLRRNLECDPENHRNERGWYVPHLVWEGWDEWERACYALRRYIILRRHASSVERECALRDTRWALEASRRCARPNLPPSSETAPTGL